MSTEHIAPPPYEGKGGELPGMVANMDDYQSQPSAPPPPEFGTPYEQLDHEGRERQPAGITVPDGSAVSTEETPLGQRAQRRAWEKFVNSYVSYSIANQLRKYIVPQHEEQDPELDVEAQFGRDAVRNARSAIAKRKRLQCTSGWLWCFGVILTPLYVALPVLMIVFGVVGIGECPFRGDTIIVYLIGGGILFGLMVVLRVLPSLLTCLRARGWCMAHGSSRSAKGICSIEIVFYLFLLLNFLVLFLGTYTIFTEAEPPSCSDSSSSVPNCCDVFVYVSSATFAVSQYLLYVFSGVYLCLVLCCIRNMKSKS